MYRSFPSQMKHVGKKPSWSLGKCVIFPVRRLSLFVARLQNEDGYPPLWSTALMILRKAVSTHPSGTLTRPSKMRKLVDGTGS